ncbi:MAG: deoxyribose-phosphate aldolase [Spirochaetaceae bacterium 4572_7]|nr:MAG: deoxyribose-phosphate aldolase [Spirochaetaceae bacterium 4572_7]
MELNKFIDHTVLKATTDNKDIVKLCAEAIQYNFYAVCVNGCYVKTAKNELKDSNVKIAAVIGFPLGAMTKESKVFEAKDAIANGANEIDMVLNVGFMKSGMYNEVKEEIKAIKEAIGNNKLKVILETCYLTKDEIEEACKLSVDAKADFVKTSTGFGTDGATFENIAIMKSIVKDKAEIKAAGGVRDLETAQKFIDMGVTRLGTSSGIQLMTTGKAVEGQY